jgi:putative nucleotidyltransferase with HDIG domain
MRYLRTTLLKYTRRTGVQRGALFVLVYSMISAVLVYNLVPEAILLEVGQASPGYIGAPRQVEDRYTTQLLRQDAASAVAEVYEQNPNVYSQVLQEQQAVLALFVEVGNSDLSSEEKIEAVRSQLPWELSTEAMTAGLSLEETLAEQMYAELALAMDGVYRLGIKLDGLENARRTVATTLSTSSLRVQYRILMIELVESTMRHNMSLNEAATRRLRQEAEARVSPVIVQKTQKIIGQGEIATEREIMLLQDLGLLRSGMDWRVLAGSLLFALLCLAVPALYLYFINPTVYGNNSMVNLLGTVFIGGIVFVWAGSLVSGYLLPIAAFSILLTVLIDARVGLLAGVSLGLISAGLVGFELRFILVAFLGTAAGVYAVSHKGNRAGLVWAGLIVGLVNALAILSIGLLFGGTGSEMLRDTLLGLGGGVTSSILAIGSLPFLENAFGMTSGIKLMELSNPHQPLLKRLLVEAPGTYHHSIIVANLAEAACEQVGADALRARVAAYYHDVGKLSRPYFFIENQTMMENPHDNYPPNLSALIITSHVKDGVKLVKEHGLPEIIVDIVREHHGTSLVHYFYNKALNNGETKEADFAYEGPRPRSKESAIVMLADIVEAAVRSINSPSPSKIEERVRSLIKDKLYEGQLDESDLTLRDLNDIGTAFVRHLSGIFHQRIEYPQPRGGVNQSAGAMERSSGQNSPSFPAGTAAKSN